MLLRRWPLAGRIALLLLILGITGAAITTRPSLAQGGDEAWVPLTVIYTSDIKGKIEPCG
jgi:hypothetical protein